MGIGMGMGARKWMVFGKPNMGEEGKVDVMYRIGGCYLSLGGWGKVGMRVFGDGELGCVCVCVEGCVCAYVCTVRIGDSKLPIHVITCFDNLIE